MISSQLDHGSKKLPSEESKHVHFNEGKNEALASTIAEIREKQKEALVSQEARTQGYSYINLQTFPIPQDALLLLDRLFCDQESVVCFFADNDQLRLGSTNPGNPKIIAKAKELEEIHRVIAAIYKISNESLRLALKKYDAIPKAVAGHDEGIDITEETLKAQQDKVSSIKKLSDAIKRAPITEVLVLIVGAALKSGASDIHIEAEAEDIKIRMRIDGVLHDVGLLLTDAWPKVISRVKLLAGLKLNIANKPQDGRFTIFLSHDKVEVRVSTVPTSYGESVVMRLLRFSVEALQFDTLGLIGFTFTTLKREISKPNGMIIATGPTGSGKTTTLYAILNELNDPETKILTLEDPVEYKIKGINQTQINTAAGMDFAKGLRSLLRQDPDIIMVGEIRDLETADTAINAALTGHLMLSTLHTNSAAGAVPRFLAMGSKNFLLAPAINAIIGQRLVRRLCVHCKQLQQPDEATLSRIMEALNPVLSRKDLGLTVDLRYPERFEFYEAKGCEQCNDLGYRGRVGIYEILTMNKDLETIILGGTVSEYAIQETAQAHGMITMLQDGILKALAGITSVSEIFRQAE
jgi:type II secretory ATPase GspE/PulE/Tfp pilus assembly ATPase PilB-like protein